MSTTHSTCTRPASRSPRAFRRSTLAVSGHHLGREARVVETAGDFFCVTDVHAKGNGAHLGPPPDALGNGTDRPQHEGLGRSHESAGELVGSVATRGPRQVAQIGAFHVKHVVAKWNQRVRDGVPDAEVADPGPWEVTLVVETIGALWRAGQTEQFFRCHPVEQCVPRLRRGVMSLVQDHVVECGGIDGGAVAQRIDRCKDMALNRGPLALVQQLAEVAHLEHVCEKSAAPGRESRGGARRTAASRRVPPAAGTGNRAPP